MKSANVFATAILALTFLTGCVGSKATYSPREHMVTVQSHNHFLHIPLGPCGIDMPWNRDDYFSILLQPGLDRCDASQLEIYDHHSLRTQSGFVSLDKTKKKVTIDLYLLSQDFNEIISTNAFRYNGTFKYVESEPGPDMLTRKLLQNDYRKDSPAFYEP